MTTSHDMMRVAIQNHALDRDEVAVYMATNEPRITAKFAGELYDDLMAGKPCKMILARAIVGLVAKKRSISYEAAVDIVLPPISSDPIDAKSPSPS